MNTIRGELHEYHPLARYTSWRLGGVADRYFRPADLADLQIFMQQLPAEEPVTFLGLGSNVLIRDGGIRGTVVHTLNRLDQLSVEGEWIRVEAGVPCAKLAKYCAKQGFPEGAFFAGIPGTVGGALRMNAGAFNGETWQHVRWVEVLTRAGEVQRLSADAFETGYRTVKGLQDAWFVAGCFDFELGDSASVEARIQALLKRRSETQPIGTYNCGSVFRNPPNDFAARLIETANLKGFTVGGAVVSSVHANFIVNEHHATAADVEQLIEHVHATVLAHHGVSLVREVHILGEPV
ncbi:MAG: UDP-N-acetylenolpyruvoylglucosamine reductase [Gammaproteobacteria bacterium RIFCSPHIGHO2_12_FULL_45_9]|nr:MAG: UDP-N-acetylenolpyruvoylglucosamine reductase [Gammaproteobacteria bacterium RIFCSPHIGHO2_12_FULL_45_9]